MHGFILFARPWWVNLLILAPAVPYFLARHGKLRLGWDRLFVAALFGIAFGFVEAAIVIYLRTAAGLMPPRGNQVFVFPMRLWRIEFFREAATMVMLGAIAWFVGQKLRERVVAFLWIFAFWDLLYYVWLRLAIGWPQSFLSPDLLFLIPVPWFAQVWFPILVSSLTILAVCLRA
jgi:hypothetical protein